MKEEGVLFLYMSKKTKRNKYIKSSYNQFELTQ